MPIAIAFFCAFALLCSACVQSETPPVSETTAAPTTAHPSYISQFTELEGNQRDAAWSPDGQWIAYGHQSEPGVGKEDIWKKSLATGELVQLTRDPAPDNYPTWSPDGQWIAFTSDRGGQGNVWVVSADGQRERQVTTNADSVDMDSAGGTITSISPDGQWIAYTASINGNQDIWIIPFIGGQAQQITSDATADYLPSFSPDGQRIAFASSRSGNMDIWTIPITGGQARQITTNPASDNAPAWSPDGEWIAFHSTRGKYPDIWMIPAEGGPALQVTDTPLDDRVPRYSPDGTRIAVNSFKPWSQLWIMDAKGGGLRMLVDEVYSMPNGTTSISPDGTTIAYIAQSSAGKDVWLIATTGGEPIQLTQGGLVSSGFAALRFSPDGQRIAFSSDQGGDTNIWTVPTNGGRPRQITIADGQDVWMDWSPDGRTLVFTAHTGDNWNIWTVPSSGGKATQLVDWASTEWGPTFSPDGQQIAFVSNRDHKGTNGGIWTMATNGGEPTLLTAGASPAWSPDGREIIFTRNGTGIMKIPARGGKAVTVLAQSGGTGTPTFSPDGQRILFNNSSSISGHILIADLQQRGLPTGGKPQTVLP